MCQPLTRRQFLRFAALVAATYPLIRTERSLAQIDLPGVAVPHNLELVTVTDTQAVMTWFTGDPSRLDEFGRPLPVAAPGRVLMGTDPNPLTWEVVASHSPTPYHYVELEGLQPGTTYYWRAESNGVPAIPAASVQLPNAGLPAPPVFTTLRPPPGREIFRVAWLNDLHIGELVSGLAISNDDLPRGGFPPGFPVDPDDPYWRTMARVSVRQSTERGCRLLLANGDLTNEAEPAVMAEARQTLDAFGKLGLSRELGPDSEPAYFVTRGNHDRTHQGEQWASCSPLEERPELRDCFIDTFAEGFDPGSSRFSVAVGDERARYRFVGLDSNFRDQTGVLPPGELEYLEAEVARGDATIPLCHHPVGDLADLFGFPPTMVGLESSQAGAFREILSRGNVAGVYNGHTHRNHRSRSTDTGTIPYFEGAAVKEYPGGYTVVRLFEAGYMVNFWKASTPEALAWSERSRGEYLGLYPYYTLGSLEDRNWVHAFDARHQASAVTAEAEEEEAGVGGVVALPETGGSTAATGLAVGAAGAAAWAAMRAKTVARPASMGESQQ